MHAGKQWSLADTDHLRYRQLLLWDRAMMKLDDTFGFVPSPHQWVTHMDEKAQVLVFERGPLVFVLNWHPSSDYEGFKVATPVPGKWRVALDSDAREFGGSGRVGHDVDHFTQPSETIFQERHQYMHVLSPSRTAVAYYRVEDGAQPQPAALQNPKQLPEEGAEAHAAPEVAPDVGVAASATGGPEPLP
ncbi:hypothetical protein FOA52_009459 [Chlamydomonas sp. UWO 241]|nr:hypothetical protein FOA52_009459 [Chlamydomonas sp. UWO 241]